MEFRQLKCWGDRCPPLSSALLKRTTNLVGAIYASVSSHSCCVLGSVVGTRKPGLGGPDFDGKLHTIKSSLNIMNNREGELSTRKRNILLSIQCRSQVPL